MNSKMDNYLCRRIDEKIIDIKRSQCQTFTQIGGYVLSGSLIGPIFMENPTDILTVAFTINLLLLGVSSIKCHVYRKQLNILENEKVKVKQKKYYALKRISNF